MCKENLMTTYDINSYDFINNKGFQAFLKDRIGDKWLKPEVFCRQLNNAKKEWINLLTTPNPIIHKYLKLNDLDGEIQ